MEERVDLLEMGESQHKDSIEDESKLHNNSIEEERKLKSQFVAISKLCTSDIKSFSISWPWKRPSDEVINPTQGFAGYEGMSNSRWTRRMRELSRLML